jgi:hypothetical protein
LKQEMLSFSHLIDGRGDEDLPTVGDEASVEELAATT